MTIDSSAEFLPLDIAVITVSDTRTPSNDKSGDILVNRLVAAGHHLCARTLVLDEADGIIDAVNDCIHERQANVVILTGGTGVTRRDVTPEALERIFDKKISGFGEMFRHLSFAKIGMSAVQSRAMAGVVDGAYVFSLPGSPSACLDAWDGILLSQLDIRTRPCNFAEMIGRL